jgi:hypothetical protein
VTAASDNPQRPWQQRNDARRVLSPDEQWASALAEKVLAACHPWQRQAVEDPARRISLLVGRGGGKTTSMRARGVTKLARIQRGRILYFATTRDQAVELNWEPLKDLIEKAGERDNFEFTESKLTCRCKRTGARYKMVGADDKQEIEKYRGQPFDEVQIDEGASHSPELLERLLFRIIGPRLGERDGRIVVAGTPGHILRGPFYDATRPGSELHRRYAERDAYPGWAKWSSHAWTLKLVAEQADAAQRYRAQVALWREALIEKDANGWSDDHPVWRREYLGEWAADDQENIFKYRPHVDGKPWNQWDPQRVGPMKIAKLPEQFNDYVYGYGIDLGAKDPFALNIGAMSPSDPTRTLYHVYGFEQRAMYARAIAELLVGQDAVAQVQRGDGLPDTLGGLFGATGWPNAIVADLAGLGEAMILELAEVYGIQIKAAQKKDKFGAFEITNGDLVDGKVKILKDSLLEQQMMSLQWKADEFGAMKEDKAQANHSTDSWVYLRTELSPLLTGQASPPAAPAAAYADPQSLPGDDEPRESTGDEYGSLLSDGGWSDPWG